MSEEHPEDKSFHPSQKKKRGLYKQYKYDKTKQIPRQTIQRWKKKEEEERTESLGNSDVDATADVQVDLNETDDGYQNSQKPDPTDPSIDYTAIASTATDNFAMDDQDNCRWFQFHSDSDESEMSSSDDDSMFSSSDDEFSDASDDDHDTLEAQQQSQNNLVQGNSSKSSADSRLDDPLYAFPTTGGTYNSPLSRKETCTSILAYALKHCSTYSAIQDLLDLIDLVLPSPNRLPKSVFSVKKALTPDDLTKSAVYHQFCSGCFQILKDLEVICGTCGRRVNHQTGAAKNFFVSIDVKQQIQSILERKYVWSSIQQQFQQRDKSTIDDVINGRKYLSLCCEGEFLANPNNLSLIFNTDGIPLFKSSKQKIWPVYLAINELPPKQRFSKKNLILWGIWQGCQMPVMTTFLSPFIVTLRNLKEEGVQFKHPENGKVITSHFKLLLGSLDLQARAILCNMHHHNGSCGCLYCEEEGVVVPSGKGHCRCYPFNDEVVLRSKESLEQNAIQAQASRSKAVVKGIKGISVFMALGEFDLTIGIVVDYMHGILLGVTKTVMQLWFLPKNGKRDYYIGMQVEEVDRRLKAMVPPDFIKRPPRSISQLKYWKASEFRNWLLFYGIPCVQGILQEYFLYHFALLVEGIYILLGDDITQSLLQKAENMLLEFYRLYPKCYGGETCGLNVHNIRHLVVCVQNWGPLWAWSCFGFEGMNGEMMKFVHGTKNICLQILWMVSAQKVLSSRGSVLDSGSKFQKFLVRMMATSNRLPKQLHHAKSCSVAGKMQSISTDARDIPVPVLEKIKQSTTEANEINCSFKKAYRVVRHGEFYYSEEYTKCKKRNGYTVAYHKPDIQEECFGKIQYFVVVQPSMDVLAIIQPFSQDLDQEKFCHLIPIKPVERNVLNLDAIPFNCVGQKCFFLAGNTESKFKFVAKIPNSNEKD